MITTLYNRHTGEIGKIREGYYLIKGERPVLPEYLVELEVIYSTHSATPTQVATSGMVVDLELKQYRQEWTVRDMTAEEMASYINAIYEQHHEEIKEKLFTAYQEQMFNTKQAENETLTDSDALDQADMFPAYSVGKLYAQNERFYYPLNQKLYKVLQGHTSQADWLPTTAVSLYVEVTPAGVIPDWVQPTGAHDAYNIGDKVVFEGKVYESKINANVYSPTAYPAGWTFLNDV